jgi:hypothetical protein
MVSFKGWTPTSGKCSLCWVILKTPFARCLIKVQMHDTIQVFRGPSFIIRHIGIIIVEELKSPPQIPWSSSGAGNPLCYNKN